MKKLKSLFLLLLLVVTFTACHHDDDTSEKVFERTVLVYIAGDNSLRSCVDYDIDEMLSGMQGIDDSANNLLVYIDKGSSPQLVRIAKNKQGKVVQEVITTYQSRNSVSVSNMKEVFETVFSEYPANKYGMVLWSHGEGWVPSPTNNTRWWGQDGGSYMDITDLHEALKSAPHLEFLLFDACFMQSVEVAYELRDCANYIIGSPTEIPAPGAPYQKVVPAMFGDGTVLNIAKSYFEYYADPELYTGSLSSYWNMDSPWTAGVSVSVINTLCLNDLASVTKQLLLEYIQNKQVIDTSGILCYDRRYTKYYYDFDGLMKSLCTANEYAMWKAVFDDTIIYWNTTDRNYSNSGKDFSMKGALGLSTFIPNSFSTKDYTKCAWYSAAGWNNTGW